MHPITTGLVAISFVAFGFTLNSALTCTIGGSCPENDSTLIQALTVVGLFAPALALAYAIIEAVGDGSVPRTTNLGVIFVLLSLLYTAVFWPAIILVAFPIAADFIVRRAEDGT